MTNVLRPGARHPYAPMSLTALARFVHVSTVEVARWIAEGLPQTADGLIDPFACSNWLCAGRLDRCPTLARRWRTYLMFFAPFLAAQDRVRAVRWTRTQRLYLPHRPAQVQWWLARASSTMAQTLVDDATPILEGATGHAEIGSWDELQASWWCFGLHPTGEEPRVTFTTELRIAPQQVLAPGSSEQHQLAGIMEDVVGNFAYTYRHHQPWEYRATFFQGGAVDEVRASGSCLDLALALGVQLSRRQRPWRVVAGVVADSRIANPHFWLEVDTTAGWAPLDPTLPAIVRMVGGDWRLAVRAWTGACDARRVTLGVVGAGLANIPGGATCGSMMGEVVADGLNAWPCLDWVCGDCEASFDEVP